VNDGEATSPEDGRASGYPVRVGRVYGPAGEGDGARVLVDRLWPRGLSRSAADLDDWCREVAPSADLRKWFGHDPARFTEFASRYRDELADEDRAAALAALAGLRRRHEQGPVTLLTATKTVEISHAVVLADILRSGC
jgi:uncharacterized protein YeaO (DUF488 family)